MARSHVGVLTPQVEYELTDMGRDVLPILDALAHWADKWLPLHTHDQDTMRQNATKGYLMDLEVKKQTLRLTDLRFVCVDHG